MDPVQILLFAVVTILTGLLIAVGIQAFMVLWDAKRTIERVNKILDDTQILTSSVARPVQGITHFIEGMKNVKNVVDFVSNVADKTESVIERLPIPAKETETYVVAEEEHKTHSRVHALQERGRRVFHRGGKPLSS